MSVEYRNEIIELLTLGGGPIFPRKPSALDSGRATRRSGEPFPFIFDNGALEGILEGEFVLAVAAETELAIGFLRPVPPATGVLAPALDGALGGGAFTLLFARLGGPVLVFTIVVVAVLLSVVGAGVLDRGPGAGFASDASSSSRYLSPCTKNGRPYSSSHFSKTFLNWMASLGRSLAILFLIFSSLKSRVGSRFSPF